MQRARAARLRIPIGSLITVSSFRAEKAGGRAANAAGSPDGRAGDSIGNFERGAAPFYEDSLAGTPSALRARCVRRAFKPAKSGHNKNYAPFGI